MSKNVIIVESPAKAKTIGKYLGDKFIVKASVGHIRDLPSSKLGVDIENDFTPEYETIKGKGKVVAEIKKAVKDAETVYLAPDPDREGEAIAWHIAEELSLKKKQKVYRVLFNEITAKAIKEAMSKPGKINQDMVDAQQARRVLDRLVGYQISPLLWKKVKRGLSAGRVQSVAVRLVCEREAEIAAFKPEEYWSLTATLAGKTPPDFSAKLLQAGGKKVKVGTEKEANAILADLKGKPFAVSRVEKKETKRHPVPAFITSKLQQEAARKLRFTAKRTMAVAQGLYEGVEIGAEGPVGLITYMRTDSVRVSNDALQEARDVIKTRFGAEFLPAKAIAYATGKAAQDAHEAIRPTSVARDPESLKKFLDKDQYNLYKLIWNRFVASQMTPALIDQTSVDIESGKYLFRATGSVIRFPGFLKVYEEGVDESAQAEETDEKEATLPPLEKGEKLTIKKIEPRQHFTQPPPRYTEASLVKELEEKGIGRPSTYAAIMSTIQEREYVDKVENKFKPTDLGFLVNGLLVEQFPDLLDVEFTAGMEKKLDEIEEGKAVWVETIREFYGPFKSTLDKATTAMRNVKTEEIPTDLHCEKCGGVMVIKWGRNGQFLACSSYPECKNTKEFVKTESGEIKVKEQTVEETGEACPKCGSPMVLRTGRFGKFIACSKYPDCKTTKAITTGVACPEPGCGGALTEKRSKKGKVFFSCSNYPKCKYATWDRPVAKPCPQCKAPFMVEKVSKKTGAALVCVKEGCGYKEEM